MDILSDIYELIKDDPFIDQHIGYNYSYNEMPDIKTISTAHIAINPIVNGSPVEYADGKRIADAKVARVDVLIRVQEGMSENPRLLTSDIMERIADILDDNFYSQTAEFPPDYEKTREFEFYRESRSFKTNYYRSGY